MESGVLGNCKFCPTPNPISPAPWIRPWRSLGAAFVSISHLKISPGLKPRKMLNVPKRLKCSSRLLMYVRSFSCQQSSGGSFAWVRTLAWTWTLFRSGVSHVSLVLEQGEPSEDTSRRRPDGHTALVRKVKRLQMVTKRRPSASTSAWTWGQRRQISVHNIQTKPWEVNQFGWHYVLAPTVRLLTHRLFFVPGQRQ